MVYHSYKYKYIKVLCFIATKGSGTIESGDHYLSCFSDIYSNVSVRLVVHTHFIGSRFNACNEIYNHNSIRKSDLVLEKYWVTQSGYFRFATAVVLDMGIIDDKLPLCHGISEKSVDKNI